MQAIDCTFVQFPVKLICLSCAVAFATWNNVSASDPDGRPTILRTTLTNRATLLSLQERVRSVSERAFSVVVACEIHGNASAGVKDGRRGHFDRYASGVIVTPEGIVLSQAHVTHQPLGPGQEVRRPGERTLVVLSDGRKIEAELLGASLHADLSLLRLLEPGPYPYASIDPSAVVELGDWVIKLGHPLGLRQDRPPVVRMGRVLYVQKDMFVSDCNVTGGDSGGPYFDIQGRLIGLPGSNLVPWEIQDALSPPEPRGAPLSSIPISVIQKHLDEMLQGHIVPFNRLEFEEFAKSFRWARETILPRREWASGRINAMAFCGAVQDARRSVVAVIDQAGHTVAHGVIHANDGEFITLASSLPPNPRCRIEGKDGVKLVGATLLGVDPAFDLALLKLPETDLPAIRWSDKEISKAGTLVASVGVSELPQAIGVVSVPQRVLPGPFSETVLQQLPYMANPEDLNRPHHYQYRPAVFGVPRRKQYLVNMSTPETGIEPGDAIISIAGRSIVVDSDLIEVSQNLLPGEKTTVRLIRDGIERELDADVSPIPMTGSKSYAEFPVLFEHDMRLFFSPLGGPVVDLDGNVLGITVYRGGYGCLAIPSQEIIRVSSLLKAAK